ncbi:MAG: hypothetical protein HC893_01810 [Chloroflexaceae bacterium]|nr:hypothetical protein [Chloroflexaceae bacterium]
MAVRHSAFTLAVGGIIGENAFDTLLLLARLLPSAMARIYHAVSCQQQIFFVALTMLLSTIRLMGLLYREQRGLGNVGFEGLSMLVLYIGAVILLVFNGGPS